MKLVVVGVYVDYLLFAGQDPKDVDKCFEDLKGLSVRNQKTVSTFLSNSRVNVGIRSIKK